LRSYDEKSCSQCNNKESMFDILNLKLPIDNSGFNFMIIDVNLGVSENLNNIFFLEFDLANSNHKDQIKFLRDINQEYVDREVFFILNVNEVNLGDYTWYSDI
jgi:hypothetical protein